MGEWHKPRSEDSDESSQALGRYRAMRNVSLVGLFTNIGLALTKLMMGWISQSQALIADGLHSVADGLTDAAVIVTARFSNEAADASHPYGHARIETAATAGLGLVLMATGLGIIIDAGGRLMDPEDLLHPSALALWAAGLSILVNEALYQYTRWIGRRVRSTLVLANAWHHRTDALSSVVVLVGVGGVLLGFESLDAIAAIGVALMIIHVGWQQISGAFSELVDSGLGPEELDRIRNIIESIEGVSHPHRLRTRRMGEHALIDVHVEVPPRISVSEGHQLAETIQARLKAELDAVNDVIVHIDPGGQEQVWLELPLRESLMQALRERWASQLGESALDHLISVTLHYLDGSVDLEVVWARSGSDNDALPSVLKQAAQEIECIRSVDVRFAE